jgi:hypothetical protein
MLKPVVLLLGFLIAAMPAAIDAQASGPSTVAQINAECDATWSAVSQTSPVNVLLQGRKWVILKDSQLQYIMGGTPHYAGVYKQNARYVYVHEVSFNGGKQRALGMCFRSDGTLERARQAKTVPDLSKETAQVAYYADDGTPIQMTPAFDKKDPTIALRISDLRYFSVLPPP